MYQIKQYLNRALDILRQEGAGVLLYRIRGKALGAVGAKSYDDFDQGYERWRAVHSTVLTHAVADEKLRVLSSNPLFSILMPVYKVDKKWLEEAIHSVMEQSYPHWQLCVVDDASQSPAITQTLESFGSTTEQISILLQTENKGIAAASNDALGLARGDYVVLLDHDDVLVKDALLHLAEAIDQNPNAELIYSDEDKIDTRGKFSTPFFKPGFSPELLESQNYFGHLVCIKKSLVEAVGGFRTGFDGAQDFDLVLRASRQAKAIHHIPGVLYHWREIPGSTAAQFGYKSHAWDAGLDALKDHIEQVGLPATAAKGTHPGTYRLQPQLKKRPGVSVILPFRDKGQLLDSCLTSLFAKTTWPEIEVIAINNQSEETKTMDLMRQWKDREHRIHFVDYDFPFNYSAICNFGVEQCMGEYVVLLNNDIEILTDQWVDELFLYASRPGVGAVGAQLVYPDQSIQHAGIVLGIDGGAGHPFKHFPVQEKGYFMRLSLTSNVTAVTGALMMVEKSKYLDVGGLDEDKFPIAYNDVDFCLKLCAAGYRNAITANCRAIHNESLSRGLENTSPKRQREEKEKSLLRERWSGVFEDGDPYYNPNLTLSREDYTLRFGD